MSQFDLYKYCPKCKSDLVLEKIDDEDIKKCSKCGFIFWNKSKPVVSIVLHKDGKILMLQRSNEPFKGYWVLPGGFIKSSETAEEAVKREAREEIGIDVVLEQIFGTYLIDNDPRGLHLDIIFSGTIDGEISLSKEDRNWEYFAVDSFPEKIAYKHRKAINDWNEKTKP